MLDERVHITEGRLEGREPIRGLLRNIEENLHTISDSPHPGTRGIYLATIAATRTRQDRLQGFGYSRAYQLPNYQV
jgi:hypothetical protein